jgi:hypothetical protein
VIAPASVPDAGAFLSRVVRLDPAALVRLRPLPGGRIALWSWLPFDVLVSRAVDGGVEADATVRAADLLATLPAGPPPPRYDAAWRGALPPPPGPTLEAVPAAELRRIADAAAGTLRASAGRGVGERRLRDAILDHVAITLTARPADTESAAEVPVPTRIVTALVRMAFLGDDPVRFGVVGTWLAAHATFGSAWYQQSTGLRVDVTSSG